MSAIANLIAFDGAATPVTHTLTPISVTREKGVVLAEWRELVSTVPAYAQIRQSMKMEKSKNGVYRLESRTVVPVMESVSGQNASGYTAAPKVAFEDTVAMTQFAHERSTVASRRLVRQLSLNINGGITTTVTPVTTGPAPELFDLLVAPT